MGFPGFQDDFREEAIRERRIELGEVAVRNRLLRSLAGRFSNGPVHVRNVTAPIGLNNEVGGVVEDRIQFMQRTIAGLEI